MILCAETRLKREQGFKVKKPAILPQTIDALMFERTRLSVSRLGESYSIIVGY